MWTATLSRSPKDRGSGYMSITNSYISWGLDIAVSFQSGLGAESKHFIDFIQSRKTVLVFSGSQFYRYFLRNGIYFSVKKRHCYCFAGGYLECRTFLSDIYV